MTDANLAPIAVTAPHDAARAAYRRWRADQDRQHAADEARRRERLGRIRAAVERAVTLRLTETIATVLLPSLTDDDTEFATGKNGRWITLRTPGAAPVRVELYARIHGDDISVAADNVYAAEYWATRVDEDDARYVYVTGWEQHTDPFVLFGAALERGPEYERTLAEIERLNNQPPAAAEATTPMRPPSAEWLEQAEIELEECDTHTAAACAMLAIGHLLTEAVALLNQAERRAEYRDYVT